MKGRAQVLADNFRGGFFRSKNGCSNHPALILSLLGIVLWCAGCGFTPGSSISAKALSAALETNPSSLSFGSVVVGDVAAKNLTLTSDGTASVTVTSAAVGGAGFSVTGASFPLTLAAGQSKTLQVKFDPASSGNATSTLTLTTDASSGAKTTVALSGEGQSAAATTTATNYAVDLQWQQPGSGSTPIMGYNIYRAASSGVPYQQLNAALDTALSFTDDSVQSGSTYTYYVASVANSGLESTPSNTITLTVP